MLNQFLTFLIAITNALLGAYAFAELPNVETVTPPALLEVIQRQYPQYKIVQANDIDLSSCEEPKNHPGLVEGDFNGDGYKDYAVLLKSLPKREFVWEGKTWKEIDAKFAIFLGLQQGGFNKVHEENLKNLDPLFTGLQPVPLGVVEESRALGNKKATLRHPGVLLYHCEKSAAVYYWDRKANRFEVIWVAD